MKIDIRIKIFVLFIAGILMFPGCAYHRGFVKMPDIPLYNQAVMLNSVQYIPLLRFCDYYDLEYNWDLISQRIEIKKGNNKIVLRPNSNYALVNKKAIELDYPAEYKDGSVYIPVKTAVFLSEDIFRLKVKVPVLKGLYRINTIVIDPGHGGKDPGAKSIFGTREKDIVLDVSKRLKEKLEEDGLNVILTRRSDVFIPLHQRPAIANAKKADLFISIHANASRSSQAKGFEVYYLSEATDDYTRAMVASENASMESEEINSPTEWDLVLTENRRESKELAYYICNITADKLYMLKRGVKAANFTVLRGAFMPAVLVEIGFLTNRWEERKLKKGSFRDDIADALYTAITTYKREYEKTNGFSN